MPVVTIEFDSDTVSEAEIQQLVEASHKIVSGVTNIEDVPVYAHIAKYKTEIAPIEIFIQLSAHKIDDPSELTAKLKTAFAAWKGNHSFRQPINMTLIPMQWSIEIGI